ncbi:Voltage-gated hydrogen channel 1 [Halotydeus destructor]|nr:Voltage-gated hydrogen channel 1 [Halotydeus destructor]
MYQYRKSKEHLIRGSDSSIWGLSGFEIIEDDDQSFSERMWLVLNHKIFNTVIVILVIVETLIISAELLLNLDMIHDASKPFPANVSSAVVNSSVIVPLSNKDVGIMQLIISRKVLSQVSLIIVTIFVSEVLLRIFCGRFKYLVQPFELLDSLLVLVVFILDLVFYLRETDNPSKASSQANNSGEEAALLIVILRLWRIQKIVQSIVEDAQAKVLNLLMVCEKEKNQAEHKVDILILKVEDLEHEVAYLKEKAKRSEKETAAALHHISLVHKKKPSASRTSSTFTNNNGSITYCPCRLPSPIYHYENIGLSDSSARIKAHRSISAEARNIHAEEFADLKKTVLTNVDLNLFALKLAQSITKDVVTLLISANDHCPVAKSLGWNGLNSTFLKKITMCEFQPNALEMNDNVINSVTALSPTNESTLSSTNSDDSGNNLELISSDQSSVQPKYSDPIALTEQLEIERITRLDYANHIETDIPLTSL